MLSSYEPIVPGFQHPTKVGGVTTSHCVDSRLSSARQAAETAYLKAVVLPADNSAALAAAEPHDRPAGILEVAVTEARTAITHMLQHDLLNLWFTHASPAAKSNTAARQEDNRLNAPCGADETIALAALTAHSNSWRLASIALHAIADAVEKDPRLINGDGHQGFIARHRRAATLLENRDNSFFDHPPLTVREKEEAEELASLIEQNKAEMAAHDTLEKP